jgi:hypothetical protein
MNQAREFDMRQMAGSAINSLKIPNSLRSA